MTQFSGDISRSGGTSVLDVEVDRRLVLTTLVATVAAVSLSACGVSGESAPAPSAIDPTPTDEQPPATQEQSGNGEARFAKEASWEQNFKEMSDGPVDPTVWKHDTDSAVPTYNNEKQGYTPQNSKVQDGRLVIEARREKTQYHLPGGKVKNKQVYEYSSGSIMTYGTWDGDAEQETGSLPNGLTFEHGMISARIKMPKGRGAWPAFWLLSANQPNTKGATDADWANDENLYLKNGEIDVVEYYGRQPDKVEGTFHTYDGPENGDGTQITLEDCEEAFHDYAVQITPTSIVWLIDGKEYKRATKSSDDTDKWPIGNGNRFYVKLNLALGGTGGGEIDDSKGPWKMEVENVKFFDYIPEPAEDAPKN